MAGIREFFDHSGPAPKGSEIFQMPLERKRSAGRGGCGYVAYDIFPGGDFNGRVGEVRPWLIFTIVSLETSRNARASKRHTERRLRQPARSLASCPTSYNELMRVGMIGTGAIAHKHAAAYRNIGFEIVACAGLHAERGRAFADQYGCEFVARWQDLCAHPRIDFVDLCTFPDFRLEARAGLRGGGEAHCRCRSRWRLRRT